MEWRDLQIVLAIADAGGLQAAADALGVHATTVSRRIRHLESSERVRLFERYRHGVVLTDAGAEAVQVARDVRTRIDQLTRRLHGRDEALSGVIRLTSVDSLLRAWMPDFATFQERYPDIQLELSSGLGMANLTQREADVAVRIASSVPEHLVGWPLSDVAHAVYGAPALVDHPDASRGTLPWVSYDLSVFRGVDGYLAARYPEAKVAMRVPRIDLLVNALEDGVGIGILNCHAGDRNPRLQRLGPADAGTSKLWVLTHPELRGATRISTFLSFLRTLVKRDQDLFEGRTPQRG